MCSGCLLHLRRLPLLVYAQLSQPNKEIIWQLWRVREEDGEKGNLTIFAESPQSCWGGRRRKSQTHYNCHFSLAAAEWLGDDITRCLTEICRSKRRSVWSFFFSLSLVKYESFMSFHKNESLCDFKLFSLLMKIVKNCSRENYRLRRESCCLPRRTLHTSEIGSNDKKLLVITYEMKVFLLLQLASAIHSHPLAQAKLECVLIKAEKCCFLLLLLSASPV